MQICQRHWNMIRTEIEKHGLTEFVSKSGEEAMERSPALTDPTTGIPDPLMLVTIMLTERAVMAGGSSMLMPKEDGTERCPCCEALAHTEGDRKEVEVFWTEGPVLGVVDYFVELGIIPAPPAEQH